MIDKSKYVVLDVETNGLTSSEYDLLSISLYMPDNDKKYERYLPLEKNNMVFKEASAINGITNEKLLGKTCITQQEWDALVNEFELDTREILHYGKIDPNFIKEYLARHSIKGFNKLTFHNIKRHFLTNSFSNGEFTKDNLCRGLGIEGVAEVHNGLNDCVLEWKLFEKIQGEYIICYPLGNWTMGMYKLNPEYYIPASRVRYYPNMKYAVNLPKIRVDYEEVFSLELSKKCENRIDEFAQPAGFASEKIISAMLNAVDISDDTFASNNFKNLELIGQFSYEPEEHIIPVMVNNDGTLTASTDDKEDKALIKETNRVMKAIRKEIPPLIKYIKDEIFQSQKIFTQEVIIDNSLRAFGYCDFSNDKACLEMKFSSSMMFEYLSKNSHPLMDKHKYQLYILSQGRPTYLLVGAFSRFVILKVNFYVGKESIKQKITSNRQYVTRSVTQYDRFGNKIKVYESAKAAAEDLGFPLSVIRDNCRGRHLLTRGFQFKYEGSDKEIIDTTTINRTTLTKHVLQYDENGIFMREYESAKKAFEATGVNPKRISMVCTGKRKKAGGYLWRYKEN